MRLGNPRHGHRHARHAMALWLSCMAGAVLTVIQSEAVALPPACPADRQLAKSPVIVVARWEGATWEHATSHLSVTEACDGMTRTRISILRTIQGDVRPGNHSLLVKPRISWSVSRPRVVSGGSTEVCGDADATKPTLWFLCWSRRKDAPNRELVLKSYRAVQPLSLEQYYLALRSGKFSEHLGALLGSSSEIVLNRTLLQIAGEKSPWPYVSPNVGNDQKAARKPVMGAGRALADMLRRRPAAPPHIRALSLAVLADLEGRATCTHIRPLLRDENQEVRSVAFALSVRFGDFSAMRDMIRAAQSIRDGCMACRVIDALISRKESVAVPILIEFLQNDTFCYRIGKNLGIPAIKTREALEELTGCTFPFDVERSRSAWSSTKDIKDVAERSLCLARKLAEEAAPWLLDVKVVGEDVVFVITNRGKRPLSLARYPTDLCIHRDGGSYSFGGGAAIKGAGSFVAVPPGGSIRWKPTFKKTEIRRLVKDLRPGDRGETTLFFLRTGREYNVKAWIGSITLRDVRKKK